MSNFGIANYNPDVLSCLANLSNDEVFTPPELVNQILDILPKELFESPSSTFLDPVCKTGVYLREIAKRLNKGLESQIPDLQKRLNHIFTKQLYGISITELTSLLARRSVYCSKYANSQWSICTEFITPTGNIRFMRSPHFWRDDKCFFCGATKSVYDRGNTLETHAYEFIHTTKPEELFGVKFDVIIGNPPYQLSTGGSGVQATPLYHMFVTQAKKMKPRYLSMIIPSRWFSGGFGLDAFREEMLHDDRIRQIHDFPEASDCFGTGVQIKGGVCYFLWDREQKGDCTVTTHRGKQIGKPETRPLLEEGYDFFIRYNEAISILHKVWRYHEENMDTIVSSQKPFGLATNFEGSKSKREGDIVVYGNKGIEHYPQKSINKNRELINCHKVLIPRAGSGSDSFPHQILGKPFIPCSPSVCTETYIVIGPFSSRLECENAITYIQTRFFRFLVMLIKPTQDALRKVYSLVPIQDFTKCWTDEDLYMKYSLVNDEIAFIESMIRPMEVVGESANE